MSNHVPLKPLINGNNVSSLLLCLLTCLAVVYLSTFHSKTRLAYILETGIC